MMARKMDLSKQLERQWLQANRLGGYSTTTFAGCNTSRYHGLLVAAANPPVERIMAVSTIMETLQLGEETLDLATNEFSDNIFSPHGWEYVRNIMPPTADEPATVIEFKNAKIALQKSIVLDIDSCSLIVKYELTGQRPDEILLRPFTPLRDFHSLCKCDEFPGLCVHNNGVAIEVSCGDIEHHRIFMSSDQAEFVADQTWWYRFFYSQDASRGQDSFEDLPSPGFFRWDTKKSDACELVINFGQPEVMTFDQLVAKKRSHCNEVVANFLQCDESSWRLALAGDDFIVQRTEPGGRVGASILAGFPWFADWGRDTFIALPGLTLTAKRFELARDIFRTYGENISRGMIPNRFDDYGGEPHYNSIDASLWFILAAYRYMQADKSAQAKAFWNDFLRDACVEIVSHYRSGTRFDIHEDSDGLIVGGDENTQLTWMDAKINSHAVTPRHGKAVEINALWYLANSMLAADKALDTKSYKAAAGITGRSFIEKFWLADAKYLADCVYEAHTDESFRPNQIIAAALPVSPLNPAQRTAVVNACRKNLLTPMGLRTLPQWDSRYHGRYVGPQDVRDVGYHQGTVWAWPIGFFVEAYMQTSRSTKKQGAKFLARLISQLDDGCVGQINEIFDGDSPHWPRGCFAQAWSIAEVLRATELLR